MHPSNAWQVENVRLSFFFDPEYRQQWLDLWGKIVNTSPESKTEKPALLTTVEEGEWAGRLLGISIQHNRADIVISAKINEPTLPNAGSLADLISQLEKVIPLIVSKERAPTIKRVGFGAILLAPADSHEKGYERLAEFLPEIKIDPKSKDFFYQINRPTASNIRKSAIINRLSKWSVMVAKYVTFEESGVNNIFSSIANRLELDINSAEENNYPKDSPFNENEVLELITLGKEISEKGDLS